MSAVALAGACDVDLVLCGTMMIGPAPDSTGAPARGNECRFVAAFHPVILKEYRRLRCSLRS
jgi:hypothetical protein